MSQIRRYGPVLYIPSRGTKAERSFYLIDGFVFDHLNLVSGQVASAGRALAPAVRFALEVVEDILAAIV